MSTTENEGVKKVLDEFVVSTDVCANVTCSCLTSPLIGSFV